MSCVVQRVRRCATNRNVVRLLLAQAIDGDLTHRFV